MKSEQVPLENNEIELFFLIAGDDSICPVARSMEFADRMNADSLIIENAGHYSFGIRPKFVFDELLYAITLQRAATTIISAVALASLTISGLL